MGIKAGEPEASTRPGDLLTLSIVDSLIIQLLAVLGCGGKMRSSISMGVPHTSVYPLISTSSSTENKSTCTHNYTHMYTHLYCMTTVF